MTAQPVGVMPLSGALPTTFPDPDPDVRRKNNNNRFWVEARLKQQKKIPFAQKCQILISPYCE